MSKIGFLYAHASGLWTAVAWFDIVNHNAGWVAVSMLLAFATGYLAFKEN